MAEFIVKDHTDKKVLIATKINSRHFDLNLVELYCLARLEVRPYSRFFAVAEAEIEAKTGKLYLSESHEEETIRLRVIFLAD